MTSIRSSEAPKSSMRIEIARYGTETQHTEDFVSVEEPLEIRLGWWDEDKTRDTTISVTMRTPGNELDLAIGFLVGEGIVAQTSDIEGVEYCGPPSPDKGYQNVVRVRLARHVKFDPQRLERHFYTTSSCGVCGKTSLEAVRVAISSQDHAHFTIEESVLRLLPRRLKEYQTDFRRTGGLHAAATFDGSGRILRVREDIGRHNAVDKLIGSYFREPDAPLSRTGLLLSGRGGFELVQKAAVVGMPLVASIGPPSSLAIELAREQSMTLIGFLRADGFNAYTGDGVVGTGYSVQRNGT